METPKQAVQEILDIIREDNVIEIKFDPQYKAVIEEEYPFLFTKDTFYEIPYSITQGISRYTCVVETKDGHCYHSYVHFDSEYLHDTDRYYACGMNDGVYRTPKGGLKIDKDGIFMGVMPIREVMIIDILNKGTKELNELLQKHTGSTCEVLHQYSGFVLFGVRW